MSKIYSEEHKYYWGYCYKDGITVRHPFKLGQRYKCPTCDEYLDGMPSYTTFRSMPNEKCISLMFDRFTSKIKKYKSRIQLLETQLKTFSDLDKRLSVLEYSGPNKFLPEGGPKFQELIQEAREAGDFS